ncbi:EAL domain-containing protein [Agrobacterium larrymoorei]|uniref:putative bifunctional diguanylate cyclase/phosphodiesterase n=1 Tax=Agrobacterium larrymoorei TaxID=160699 RepID=UPI001573A6E0|nr:EAL domain-containing protein [Agrobacterium larrymoorei]NTJ43059.1 EAL domain-containing protein [Agrobacterium larrymoorei]
MTQSSLHDAIVTDQLLAVRKTVAISIPVNVALGIASLLVAFHAGKGLEGVLWFIPSALINIMRLVLCHMSIRSPEGTEQTVPNALLGVDGHLQAHWITAMISGIIWAFIPILCDWYTSPQTLFYLTVVCGITAGAATHGFAYARIPFSFIIPPLSSVVICLIVAGGFERYILAGTVLIYLAALIRGIRVGETLVINDSRLKNEATALSRSLELAHQQKTLFAQEMQRRAIRDQLTGLLNRHGFTEKVEQLTASGTHGTLMLLDLDGFKSVNDAFGHKAGDRVLVEVARRLTEAVGDQATLARLGGDEFAILLDSRLSDEDAEVLATRLITTISIPFYKLDAGRVGASVGVYLGDVSDIDEMMVYADTALYAAKKEGRNRFRLFDDGLRRRAQMNRDVERDLPNALANEALQVFYQPIMSDYGRTLDAFEALLRWKHPKHGWISPLEIVAAASATGFSEPLLRFIMRDVALMALTLRSVNAADVRIAVNISPRELVQLAVDDLILTKLENFGVSASVLELEITEEAAINPRLVQEKLTKLSNAGVRLAIDDFGTGYSSLGTLQQLRVDRVKIDKSFVTGTTLSSSSLVDAVLRVSHAYGFDVVAEGVETEEDLKTMRALGCSLMQGHLFSEPMPKDKAILWLENSNGTKPDRRN